MSKKWQLCLLLLLATALNYLDRQTIAILAPVMQKEMHLDNVALGWIFSTFYYAYTLAQFVAGPILDRCNLRWGFGFAVLGWSAISMLTGSAKGFATLLLFRFALGLLEAANWPGAIRIVARALKPGERAMGNGIFTSGSSIGALAAPGLILAVSAAFGWRSAFVACGSLGLIWFLGWFMFTRSSQLAQVWSDPEPAQTLSVATGVLSVVRSPSFVPVLIVAILVNPCVYFSVNWLPTYFAQQRGLMPGRQLGWILTAIYLGLDLGNLACGAGVIILTRRSWSLRAARRAVFVVATLGVACCAAVPLCSTLRGAVLALIAVNFGLGIWTTTYLTMAQEVSPTNISTSIGILSGCGSLVGAWAMWGVGKVTHFAGSFTIPMGVVAAMAIGSACAAWAAGRGHNSQEAVAG
jgi:MFS transporter, ACS family, hexuronate transporter